MKRICSIAAALAIALSLFPASAFAREKGVDQRIADIRAEYGITVTYDSSVLNSVPAYLDNVEEALAILGPVFTLRAMGHLRRRDRTFRLEIVAFPSSEGRQWVDALYFYDSTWDSEQVLSLYVKAEKRVTTMTVLHEFGHLLHNCVGYDDFIRINGGPESYQSPVFQSSRYVTGYAMVDDCEDFAENFAYMVSNNKKAAAQYAKLPLKSSLYQKYEYVFKSIRSLCGDNSRLTVAAAQFTGIDM